MNEKTINALVFAPRNWVSKANAKFNQESDREMLSYDFINLDNGKLGNFSCEAAPEAIEKIGMANVAYSDLSKSPVRIFQLDYIMKTSGLNEYANFSKARSVAELFHYEIKK